MAALNKSWGTLARVSPAESAAVVTGEGEEAKASEPAERVAASQPFLVYVTDGQESSEVEKIEKVILFDNKVCLGMWAFNCVKMTPEQVEADPLLAKAGKDVPRFIFVSHDYDDVDALEGGNLSSSKVYDAMKKYAKKSYKTNFDKNVRSMLKILVEWDKINNQRKVLDEKEKREGSDMNAADKKKLAKEREELEEAQKDADQERDELLKFELKDKKA